MNFVELADYLNPWVYEILGLTEECGRLCKQPQLECSLGVFVAAYTAALIDPALAARELLDPTLQLPRPPTVLLRYLELLDNPYQLVSEAQAGRAKISLDNSPAAWALLANLLRRRRDSGSIIVRCACAHLAASAMLYRNQLLSM
jgi:hypothetical protein